MCECGWKYGYIIILCILDLYYKDFVVIIVFRKII